MLGDVLGYAKRLLTPLGVPLIVYPDQYADVNAGIKSFQDYLVLNGAKGWIVVPRPQALTGGQMDRFFLTVQAVAATYAAAYALSQRVDAVMNGTPHNPTPFTDPLPTPIRGVDNASFAMNLSFTATMRHRSSP